MIESVLADSVQASYSNRLYFHVATIIHSYILIFELFIYKYYILTYLVYNTTLYMLLLQSLYNCVQMYFVIGCLEVYRSFFKTP